MKNIPELLSQPTGIAAIASLGIHGAIALLVPLMPVDSSKSAANNSTKSVGLMELTQADQQRLPQTTDPSLVALQTSQFPQQPKISITDFDPKAAVISPMQPALSRQPLPGIPKSTSRHNVSSVPKKQILPKPRYTRSDFNTPVSNFRISRRRRVTQPLARSPFVNDLDAQIRASTIRRNQISRNQIRQTAPLNLNRLPQVQANNRISREPLFNPSPDAIDIGRTRKKIDFADSNPVDLGRQEFKIAGNPNPETAAQQSLQDKSKLLSAASVVIPNPEQSTNPQTVVPTIKQSESSAQKKQQLLAKLNSYEKLRRNIQQEYPNAKEKSTIRQTIATDKVDTEGTVLGQLVVDPDGKVLDIKFQDRSANPQLQSRARAFFSANPPKAEQQVTSYPFQISFKKNEVQINEVQITEKKSPVKPAPSQNQQQVIVEETKKQPKNQAVVIPSSSSVSEESKNQLESSTQSGKQLIQRLRQAKENNEITNQDQ